MKNWLLMSQAEKATAFWDMEDAPLYFVLILVFIILFIFSLSVVFVLQDDRDRVRRKHHQQDNYTSGPRSKR